ncbi:hypothetical protein TWF569_010254 [Orbilia oligospora]|uniref:NTF2-like protein n=1 Tax=Orbilia oligospora TaxID=2813651 RepID=A0A7C8JSH4_ORBOL|nr:hypothetical protein TWF102_009031 [Orbilia oligospora]KAF3113937.1 hypothetical protein TWF706_009292 [Orbilia oligospora]KAF3116750.1 hypothetical protein TWF103_008504 [Orbilia oligospora]KAF3122668.1 hypothetical protein TWF703_001178 [Orbilia oligospora]KAF3134052.1 hypothetical protein TWF569_010254 [Orbilia oligospora]
MMAPQGSLTKLYSEFITSPKRDSLHNQAGLHYIGSTGSSFQSGDAIINHLKREAGWYTKKEQKILSSVESHNSVVVEISNVIEFTNGGGMLLPNLDDNFVTDQTVTLPMVHIVQFENGVIKQIRQYWDQASLLKQLGVIGKSGKNWPIRSGEEQVKLIKASVSSVPESAADASESASTRPSSKGSNQSGRESIQLFAPRELDEDVFKPAVAPPRGSIKPPGRQLHDIIGEDGDAPIRHTPKGSTGTGPRRTFFVGQEIDETNSTPDRKVTVNQNKFKHFELEHNPEKDAETPKPSAPKRTSIYTKAGSSWDFADFATPEKRPTKVSAQNARTMTWSDDEAETSPVQPQQAKPLPRKGLSSQFEIVDETPKKANGPTREPYVRMGNESNFALTDDSPNNGTEKKAGVPQARQTVVKGMEANWSNTSPLGEAKPAANFGISTRGDGMGGKKGASRHWDFEDETPKKANGAGIKTSGNGIKTSGNGMGGRMGSERAWAFGHEDEDANVHKPVYKTANDGMGGRKATGRGWGFDEVEEDEKPVKKENASFRTQSKPTSDFWSF